MQAHQIDRHLPTVQKSKALLRAHIEELSPAQQREFIDFALQLIAARTLLDEVEENVQRIQPLPATTCAALH